VSFVLEILTKMDESNEFQIEKTVFEVEPEVFNLYAQWGLSMDGISVLTECSINTMELLRIIHSHDIDEIFNRRDLLGDKIKFRHELQKWRTFNGVSTI